MKNTISNINIGETIVWFNSNWRTYYKGKVMSIEPTKSGKSYNVILGNVYTKRDKWTAEQHYSVEKHGTYQFMSNESRFTIRATVEVEVTSC